MGGGEDGGNLVSYITNGSYNNPSVHPITHVTIWIRAASSLTPKRKRPPSCSPSPPISASNGPDLPRRTGSANGPRLPPTGLLLLFPSKAKSPSPALRACLLFLRMSPPSCINCDSCAFAHFQIAHSLFGSPPPPPSLSSSSGSPPPRPHLPFWL